MIRTANWLDGLQYRLRQISVRKGRKRFRRARKQVSAHVSEHLEQRLLLSAENPAGCEAAASVATHEMTAGTNVEGVNDWMASWMFTDAFKHSRDWISNDYNTVTGEFEWFGSQPVQTNDAGWVEQLATWENAAGQPMQQLVTTLMFHDLAPGSYPAGTYRIEWDGNGTLAELDLVLEGDVTEILIEGTLPGGRHFAEFNVNAAGAGIILQLRNVDPAAPMMNFNVWMPEWQGQSFFEQRDWTPESSFSPFHPRFLESLQPFEQLRFTQILGTHEYGDESAFPDDHTVNWLDRRELTDARQVQSDAVASGIAVEYVVELANTLQKDIWVNMPHAATADYVTNFAEYVRDNLDSSLTVTVEYSNEIWNDLPWFPAYHWITGQIEADPNLTEADRFTFAASQMREDFEIWETVFTGQQQRINRVVGGWLESPAVAQQLMDNLDGHFDSVTVAAYYLPDYDERLAFDGNTTADEVLDVAYQSIATVTGSVAEHQAMLDTYEATLGREIPLVLYEAGHHFDPGFTDFQQAFAEATASPRIYEAQQLLINAMWDQGVAQFNDYQHTGRYTVDPWGVFGALTSQEEPIEDAHKHRSLIDTLNGNMIDLTNSRPTVSDIPSYSVTVGESFSVDFTIGDAETPVDSLEIIVDSSESVMIPNAHLTVTGTGSTRTLTVQAGTELFGRALVSVLVVDGSHGTAVETFHVDIQPIVDPPPVTNTPPVAQGVQLTTPEDQPLWLGLLDYSSDAETAWDQLVFAVDSVSGGSVDVTNAHGDLIFTPDPDFNGQAEIHWTITDTGTPALSASAVVEITVTAVNDEPVALHPAFSTLEDTPFEFDLSSVVTDVDDAIETLTFSIDPEWLGQIDVLADGRTARFTPTENLNGTVDFWFPVTDPAGALTWASATITVDEVNDAPTAAGGTYQVVEDDDVWIFIGDLVDDVETGLQDLVIQFDATQNGNVTRSADGWNLIFTPNANFSGTAGFDFTVFDDGTPVESASASVSVDVLPVNDIPIALEGAITTSEGTPVTIDLRDYASDVETPDDQLLFEIFTGGEASLGSDGHTVTFTPEIGFIGEYQLWYRVVDTDGAEEWNVIRISVEADAILSTVFGDWDPAVV